MANVAAISIASVAVLFTVFSFWWLHWRKGQISVGEPRVFSAVSKPGEPRLIVELPLVFSNSGAAPRVLQNLNLLMRQGDFQTLLRFNNTRDELGGEHQWATQFSVAGRSSVPLVCAFQGPGNLFPFSEGDCACELEALLDQSTTWEVIGRFTLHITAETAQKIHSGSMLVYDNFGPEFLRRMEAVDRQSKGWSPPQES